MLNFEWNTLRKGDPVLVHDPGSAELALIAGVVAWVDTRKGANGVGIRVTASAGEGAALWPSSLAVHRDPRDPTEPCWRCQTLEGRTARWPDPLQENVATRADTAPSPPPVPILSRPA